MVDFAFCRQLLWQLWMKFRGNYFDYLQVHGRNSSLNRDARKLNLTTSIVEMGADFLASGAMMGEPKVYIDPSKKSKKRKSKKKKRSQLEATKHDYGMMVHRYRQIQQYVQKAVRLHELDDGPNPRENISLMDSLKKVISLLKFCFCSFHHFEFTVLCL